MDDVLKSLSIFVENLLSLTESMYELLCEESRYLRNRDTEALSIVTSEKEALLEKINILVRTQYHELGVTDLDKKGGLDAIFSNLPTTNQQTAIIKTQWTEIKRQTAKCNHLNEENGSYIALFRQHLQRSLDLLHGRPSSALVYGPDGATHRQTSSRTLLSV